MKKYRYTDVPSLIQEDRAEDEAICFICKRGGEVDFHHILNGSCKKFSEEVGAWVWLCRQCHQKVHNYRHGTDPVVFNPYWMKELCQEVYEKTHTRDEWMKGAHRNYL